MLKARHLLLVLPLLLPALAEAQVTGLTTTISPTTLGPDDCKKDFTLQVTAQGADVDDLASSDDWSVRLTTDEDCEGGSVFDANFVRLGGATGQYSVTIPAADIYRAASNGTCGEEAVEETVFVCTRFDNESGDDPEASAEVEVDTQGPDAPSLTDVKPGNARLMLAFRPAGGSPQTWQVCFRQKAADVAALGQAQTGIGGDDVGEGGDATGEGGDATGEGGDGSGEGGDATGEGGDATGEGGDEAGEGGDATGEGGDAGEGGEGGDTGEGGEGGAGGDETSAGGSGGSDEQVENICSAGGSRRSDIPGSRRGYSLEGLRNGVTYEVQVIAIDQGGNRSEPSNILEGTPARTAGFAERCEEAGCDEEGGCASASGPASAAFVLAGLLLFLRSRARK